MPLYTIRGIACITREVRYVQNLGEKMYMKQKESVQDDFVLVAVCGLHMRGYPLDWQLKERSACFVREALTASCYRLFKLNTVPVKPGLLKVSSEGAAIQVEIWKMSADRFGSFVAMIPAPLCFGKIKLSDGTEVTGFLSESYACEHAEEITQYGGWCNYSPAGSSFVTE